MALYNVILEFDTEADSPLEAALQAQERARDIDVSWIYMVQDDDTKEVFSVDLAEDVENAVLLMPEYTPIIQ
jgi:hypothetical protein